MDDPYSAYRTVLLDYFRSSNDVYKQKYKTFRCEDWESFEQAAERLRYLLDRWLAVENVNPDDARSVKEHFIM